MQTHLPTDNDALRPSYSEYSPVPFDILLKFIVIGDEGVGKTCLLLQFTDKRYRKTHRITVGVEFGSRTLDIDNRRVKLQIWDTAGQDRFRSIIRGYYRGSAAALLVYDITQRDTFDHIIQWLDEVHNEAGKEIALTLVGNKYDLVDQRKVSYDEGHNLARHYGLNFIETSAVTGSWVEDAFLETARLVMQTRCPDMTASQAFEDKSENPWLQHEGGIRLGHGSTRDEYGEQLQREEGCC
eukprot:GEMP01072020.1.p1 GENE.GEMP01072020.1~~GEMP01072020.1.p1  ORF type:complete len:240 (+),score=35.31 GEMP01072020.1:29-748(+)